MNSSGKHIFTVSQLNLLVKDSIENVFPEILVQGELSNFKSYPSGFYFTLKDEKSQIRCVMFRGFAGAVRFAPRDGMSVLVKGSPSLYETRGEFQLKTAYMEPLGIGALKLAFEQLKKKLAAKGYFDEKRKRPIPSVPRTIGVVTSPRGSVVRDILQILRRRFFNLQILIFPVRVQGAGAGPEIAEAIAFASRNFSDSIDALILARGGGSLEDLYAFNEEAVADAIYHSRIPVISAIGHETDYTIADFVADLRAPTPSAAAELVAGRKAEIEAALYGGYRQLVLLQKRQLAASRRKLASEIRMLRSPLEQIRSFTALSREFRRRLEQSISTKLDTCAVRLDHLRKKTGLLSPRQRIRHLASRLDRNIFRLSAALTILMVRKKDAVTGLAGKLDALSPLRVLGRGYSIATRLDGSVVTDSGTVGSGEDLRVRLHRGSLLCRITNKEQ